MTARFTTALCCLALLAGCGGSLTRMQAAARDTGVAYLERHSRDAARAAGVEWVGCPEDAISVSGRGEDFTVQACQRRVEVHCTWGEGAPDCVAQPDLEAMEHEREERLREARRRQEEREARERAAAPASGPVARRPAAAFRTMPDGVLQMDAVEGFVQLRVRASAQHPDQVLVSWTLDGGGDPACEHALMLTAAGETSRIEASQRSGETTHYVFDAASFATLPDRTPIRMSVCGHTLAFGHPALRALGAFVERLPR